MKKYIFFWITFLILCGIVFGKYAVTSSKPKVTHPTFIQHQQLELRVERLEKIVRLEGVEGRKEDLQNKIK